MKEFPYSAEQWSPVKDCADAFMAAVSGEDEIQAESALSSLKASLQTLRDEGGEHPILLETEADFCFEPSQAVVLYDKAIELAEENELTTRSIKLSYAQTLIETELDLAKAQSLLDSCETEIRSTADESEIADFEELVELLRTKIQE